jgi:hypothetical protein
MLVIVYFYLILGETLGKVTLLVSLAAIVTETVTLYGCLSNLISKRVDAARAIGLGIGAIVCLLSVYRWCSVAQKVEECVSMIFTFRC